MLTEAGCQNRRRRLFEALSPSTEWVLVTDPRHVNYFSRFWTNPISFSTCERGWLLLERGGRATLLVDNFTLRSAAVEPVVDEKIISDWYDHRHSVVNRDHALLNLLKREGTIPKGRGLVEDEWLPSLATFQDSPVATSTSGNLGSIIRLLRRRKEPDEVALIEECARACAAGHARALEVTAPGVSELDVYREIQSAATAQAARPAVIYGDFRAVDGETPKRGGLPTNKVLEEGELLIVDQSVGLDGYRCDFTNTIAVGEPSDAQEELMQLCRTAMQAGEQELQPGSAAADVYRAVSSALESAGHPPLVHHAGHGIGLGHPEPPILVPESEDELIEGDVVTLEPGLYVEGIGGVRIEHNYAIAADGFRRLSNHEIRLS